MKCSVLIITLCLTTKLIDIRRMILHIRPLRFLSFQNLSNLRNYQRIFTVKFNVKKIMIYVLTL